MADNKQEKCAHELCTCIVEKGTKYCSANCEDGKGLTEVACECEHPSCKGVVAAA
jgi:hypothetical protein